MPRPSPKSALELQQDFPTTILTDWWKLIHHGWRYPLDYIHGAMCASPAKTSRELRFLYEIGKAIHETTVNPKPKKEI